MKLAEAIILRADQKTNIQQLIARLNRVAKVQEGTQPVENPQTLIAEVEMVSAEQTLLIQRINRTNMQTELASAIALQHRELDSEIQALNWTTDLTT